MKILYFVFYVLAWIALVILTILISTGIHSENKKILAFLLIGLISFALTWKGRRDFGQF